MTLLDDLKALDALFADPAKWTSGAMARDQDGDPTRPLGGGAVCFCILGGAERVTGGEIERYSLLCDALRNATGEADLSVKSDSGGVAWIRKAIDTAIKVTGGEYGVGP